MNAREQLIEKAAKAIDPPAWTGGIAHDPRWADEAEARRISTMRQARAALSVFEEAHAPTDDEREALRDAFDEMHRITEGGCDTEGKDVADMVIALGFRRTVQGEPTFTNVVADLPVPEGCPGVGVQGEPSEAAVKAAMDEYLRAETGGKVRAMRAALRAAEAEGGNRG